ncbi:hypothetical protein [Atlantibacter hermannii]|uniref:hypothetical protein n=1 Tax=Atlantibacter hermannii TaxID=565 RepID=UPI0022B76DB6|nr:hypothetical protein [Atlantibacter hermannii]MCZ7836309.1 hypothetical protein [Atlantibacter hermannii]
MNTTTMRYRNHRAAWTLRELNYVEQHYGKIPIVQMAEQLGRTPVSVRGAVQKLGLGRKGAGAWTEEEKDVIRNWYALGGGIEFVATLLPGRARNSIVVMAHNMRVRSARSWTRRECLLLKQFYPAQGTAVANMLPGRTAEAVKIKACEMGIKYRGSDNGKQRIWSDEEQLRLRDYDHLPLPDLLKYFPDRSFASVKKGRERYRRHKRKAL